MARRQGVMIDRVLLDSPSDWEDLCPLIRDAETFAQTLFAVLRRRNVAVLVTERFSRQDSHVYRSVLEAADTIIDLGRFVMPEPAKAWLRIVRSHTMAHCNDVFEFVSGRRSGLHLRPPQELVRYTANGTHSAGIRLVVPVESARQLTYYEELVAIMKGSLSPHATLDVVNGVGVEMATHFGRRSALDQLQLVAIDEFQLHRALSSSLRALPMRDFVERQEFKTRIRNPLVRRGNLDRSTLSQEDASPRDMQRTPLQRAINHSFGSDTTKIRKNIRAIPFFDNLSFLVFDRGTMSHVLGRQVESPTWGDIAVVCDSIENTGESAIAFDFAKGSVETYNCLFLE